MEPTKSSNKKIVPLMNYSNIIIEYNDRTGSSYFRPPTVLCATKLQLVTYGTFYKVIWGYFNSAHDKNERNYYNYKTSRAQNHWRKKGAGEGELFRNTAQYSHLDYEATNVTNVRNSFANA